MEIWNLGEDNFRNTIWNHVPIAIHFAWIFPSATMITIRPFDCPVWLRNQNTQLAHFPHTSRTQQQQLHLFKTHIMLMEAAMVYPIATPNRFAYWTHPQNMTARPPAKLKIENFKKTLSMHHPKIFAWWRNFGFV